MKTHLLVIILMAYVTAFAQTTDNRGIYIGDVLEDVDMGWMNTITLKENAKPFSQYGWSYPSVQTDASQRIGFWIQQTFTQRGLLGELKLSLLAPAPSYPTTSKYYDFNEAEKNNRNALPNTYGAWAKFHKCISKVGNKKYWPTPGNHCDMRLYIMANNIQLVSKQIIALSSIDEYYFVMPKYEAGIKGQFDDERMPATAAYRNFDKSPNLKNYEHYVLPAKSIDMNADSYVVIMTRDNKPLSFEQVTMGELISRIEQQFPMIQKLTENTGGIANMPELLQKAKKGFQIFKNKFKNQLGEFAYITDLNHLLDLMSFSQVQEDREVSWVSTAKKTTGKYGHEKTNIPLLRLKKGVKQSLATGAPQWIIFKIDGPINAAYKGNVEMMDNFVSRFNYDYVYRYFFGKDKVTEPYKPLASGIADDKMKSLAPAELSAAARKKAADRSILFFEDFSGTAIGATPQGWSTQRSQISGEPVAVTKVEQAEGNWLRLKRSALPKDFPIISSGDFELSFDLLVHKGDVPWGAPGIDAQLTLSGTVGERKVKINVTPGDMNRADAAGWMIINGLMDCNVSNYYSISGFTGSKPVNKASISLQKKGKSILITCNNSKVYDCATAFAPDMLLKGLDFYVDEKSQFYLSNIQIKKL